VDEREAERCSVESAVSALTVQLFPMPFPSKCKSDPTPAVPHTTASASL
jgi:hypothetical protein